MIAECKKSGSRVVVNGVKNDDDTQVPKKAVTSKWMPQQGTEKCCRLFVKEVFETTFYHLSPPLHTDKTFNKIKRFTNKVRFINKNTKNGCTKYGEKFFRNITLAESFGIENISNVPYCWYHCLFLDVAHLLP